MRDGWTTAALRDVTLKIGSGATPRGGKDVYRDTGTAFIRSQNVYDNFFSFSGLARISDEAAAALRGVEVLEGDVLVCITGESVTRTCLVDPHSLPARVSQHVAIVRPKPSVLDSGFLKAALLEPPTKSLLNKLSEAGATRRALTKAHLESLAIRLPPLDEQRAIAGVLGALDDLIDTNQRLVADLARQVELVFEARFAGLDPARTPDLPVRSFASSVRIVGGGTPNTKTADYWGGSIPWYSVVDAPDGQQPWCIDTQKKITDAGLSKSSTRLLPVGTTILSARGTVGTTALTGVPMAMNQSCYGLRSVEGSDAFTYCSTRAIVERLRQMAHGSVFSTITRDTLETIKVIHPSPDEIKSFDEAVSPLLNAARALAFEGSELRRTRDELLPLLMSGAVSVREVVADAAV